MTPKNPQAMTILHDELMDTPMHPGMQFQNIHLDAVRLRFGLDGNAPIGMETLWKEHNLPLDVILPALEHATTFMASRATV